MLVWALWGWADNKPAIRSRDQMFRIMGWKRARRVDAFQLQVRRLAQHLDRLVRDNFLLSWRILDNGVYRLEKITGAPVLRQQETRNLLAPNNSEPYGG
jgi:hypothetical protein